MANADLDLAKARDVASRYGILRSYTDYAEMVETEQPDGVVVCVGPDFHARVAIEPMEAGLAVYTEKPPAMDAAQARQVADVQERTGQMCITISR